MKLRHRFPIYGTLGIILMLVMQISLFTAATNIAPDFQWGIITGWATPVCWWAYICIVDAWLYRRKGTSLLTTGRRLLVLQSILSVAFWCLFEAYNRLMPGWHYINLDPDLSIRFLGYALAFATIMPGMFLTTELLQTYNILTRVRLRPIRCTPTLLNLSFLLGANFCIWPVFLPVEWRGSLWAFIWVGWILLLEPFNYRRGLPSLYRDWEAGNWSRTAQLMLAGAICGLLWEFWNYWAFTKWEYIFLPAGSPAAKYFEMPWVGFLGFLPFALEYFVMFHFLSSFYTKEDKLGL